MALLADIEIERIGRGLVERTLAKSDWTHQAHFAAALWLLRRHGPATEGVMPGLIRAYNEATGTANTHRRLSRDHHARLASGRKVHA